MAGATQFRIKVYTEGAEVVPEIAARARDLRPVFDSIINKWAVTNQDKFRFGIGKEASGATGTELEPLVWMGLTPQYMRQKRKKFPDWLMVATGALMESLTDPDRFFHESTQQQAAFGTPGTSEDEIKVIGNWDKRQVIFLSVDDERMIEKDVSSYLNLGENWEQIRFAQGIANAASRSRAAQMNMEFNDDITGMEE